MTRRAKRDPDESSELDDRFAHRDDHQVVEAQKALARIWGACEAICRESGRRMPAIEFVVDNADAFERAAHVTFSERLVLVCRSQLVESDDQAKGFVAELVVWEKTGSLVGISKVAVAYETLTKHWLFFCGAGLRRSAAIKSLLIVLGIDPETRARVKREIDADMAFSLIGAILGWAIERMPEAVAKQ